MKIGIARLWHEANSFTPSYVGLDHFLAREYAKGNDAAQAFQGTGVETGGVFAWAQRTGANLVFSRLAASAPGGPVEQTVLDELIDEIVTDPCFEGVDGIYVSLHGACLGTVDLSPETTLLTRLRSRFPDTPIAASFDMHCIPTMGLVAAVDAVTVYRKYPHIDMAESAERALDMLATLVEKGGRGQVTLQRCDLVLPSFNMRTDEAGPMAEIEEIAVTLQIKAADENLPIAVYPYASFAYADSPETNSGVMVTNLAPENATANARAAQIAMQMVAQMRVRRLDFQPSLPSAAEFLATRPWTDGRRWAILEPSDNPMSGGAGDTPGLLKAALEADLPQGSVFAFMTDPDAVVAARAAGLGARIKLSLGGRIDENFGAPVPIDATVEKLTDGRFVNSGPMENGIAVDLGQTAVLQAGPLKILITSACYAPNDPEYFRLHDLEPDHIPVLLAKAKNHFRASFGAAFHAFAQVETPGPAMAEATKLPFQRIPLERLDLTR